MIRVLVVEDSPVVREFLVHILGSDHEIQVVGTATDGEEAVQAARSKTPDVITMDIHMPRMDGCEATRKIMETTPTPIVVVSGSSDTGEVATTFHALEAGALAAVPRPNGIGHPDHDATVKELIQTVKLMSEVRVVRRWGRRQGELLKSPVREALIERTQASIEAVAIGASTGGPIVLQKILSGLPKDFPVPVLIVQHIAPGFIHGFVEWLSHSSGLLIQLPKHGEPILPGRAYLAPDGFHMEVRSGGLIALSPEGPENGLRPSVSYLFRSVATVYGRHAIGVLLTGMGKDGAEELKLMKEIGAVTIVQDLASCVVQGMPAEALRLDAATYVLPFEKIAAALAGLANTNKKAQS